MRASRVLLCVVGLACSGTTSPSENGDEVSFRLNGDLQVLDSRTESVTLDVAGSTFSVSAADYLRAEDLSLEISLSDYRGPGTYPLGTTERARVAVGQDTYETNALNGEGALTITQASCRTEVATDPVTGITGSVTICRARGTFALLAVSEAGDTMAVTEGRFNGTSVRGSG